MLQVATWSTLWFDELAFKLHYPKNKAMKVYWLLPGLTFQHGLREVSSDADTIMMASLVHKVKNFVLYLDHDDNISGLDWDDLVVNPIASLPKGLNPHNVGRVPSKQGEKIPEFCCNLSKGTDDGTKKGNNETDDDSDFQDSDYKIDLDDDDLFIDSVDDQVPDEGFAKGKKIQKG
jgi:hypothetical protein